MKPQHINIHSDKGATDIRHSGSRFRRGVFTRFIMLLAMVPTLMACDNFREDLEPCPQGVELRFVYDYNLDYSNAFPSQVDCVTLYVYDSTGKYLMTRTETSDVLADENWRMVLDLPAGDYRLMAYGGMACDKSSFLHRRNPESGTVVTDLEAYLRPELMTSPEGTRLHDLFYGIPLELSVRDTDTERVKATMKMIKDTNNIRIMLQNVDGTPMHDADYTYSVTDNNLRLDHANNPILQPSPATYLPWARGEVYADENAVAAGGMATYAEFSTSRLTTQTTSTLTIRKVSTGKEVLSVPLTSYLLKLKSQEFAEMGSQEFLDRNSRWNVIFFLDGGIWLQTRIIINDWVVRINDISQ